MKDPNWSNPVMLHNDDTDEQKKKLQAPVKEILLKLKMERLAGARNCVSEDE